MRRTWIGVNILLTVFLCLLLCFAVLHDGRQPEDIGQTIPVVQTTGENISVPSQTTASNTTEETTAESTSAPGPSASEQEETKPHSSAETTTQLIESTAPVPGQGENELEPGGGL